VVRVRTGPVEPRTVRVEVLGQVVARAGDGRWSHWTDATRAITGASVGCLLAMVLAARASGALGYQTFRVVEALRGAVLGAVLGVLVCGIGFAVLGGIVSAMLEEPGWTLADALARGARLGGPMGTLLGALAGSILGAITTLSRATQRYHNLRTPSS
jgi:hypothetical protein